MHDVLIAVETLHYLNYKYRCRKSNIALKLEISKAYYRVEWNFLEKIMMTGQSKAYYLSGTIFNLEIAESVRQISEKMVHEWFFVEEAFER